MSRLIDERVMMCFKAVTVNLLTVLGLLVEPITAIVKPKGSLERDVYIRENPITVTSVDPVIYPSLYSLFFFNSMLRSNSRGHQSIGK